MIQLNRHPLVIALYPTVTEYEARLERMDCYGLLAEIDELVSVAASCPAEAVERVRLYRRVLARRLLAPGTAA